MTILACRSPALPATGRAAGPWQFVLKWQWAALANGVRHFAADNTRDFLILSIGACALLGYWMHVLHDICKFYLRTVHGSTHTTWIGPAVAAACIGGAASFVVTGFALRLARSAWVASLPLSAAERTRAAGAFAIAAGSVTAVLAAILGLLISGWLRRSVPVLDAAVTAAAYSAGFSTLTILRLLLTQGDQVGQFVPSRSPVMLQDSGPRSSPARTAPPVSLLVGLDQRRPRWLGHWVLENTATLRFGPALVCLILVNAVGITASVVQAQALPALALGMLTSHLTYLRKLRMLPLASPVLRSTPLGFHAALLGIVRLPLLLSFAAAAPMMITTLAIEPAHIGRTLAYLALLLLLAVQFSVLAAGMATSKRTAILLHLTILVMAVKEGVDYQYWVLVGVLIIAALVWWRAKRSYQGYA